MSTIPDDSALNKRARALAVVSPLMLALTMVHSSHCAARRCCNSATQPCSTGIP